MYVLNVLYVIGVVYMCVHIYVNTNTCTMPPQNYTNTYTDTNNVTNTDKGTINCAFYSGCGGGI